MLLRSAVRHSCSRPQEARVAGSPESGSALSAQLCHGTATVVSKLRSKAVVPPYPGEKAIQSGDRRQRESVPECRSGQTRRAGVL
jgi:hypothetical protein